jgi:hypothetical protein
MNHRRDNRTSTDQRDLAAFRLQGVEEPPVMAQEEVCPIIKQYFDYLEHSLTCQGEQADIYQLRAMLLEIYQLLRSAKSQLREDGYLRLLDRLTAIYAKGLRVENDRAYAVTAADFAQILKSISQDFQDYDYHPSVSLLLHYMDKLFKTREASWLEVYEHLLSMPDSIHFMHRLKTEHLNDISCWIEEGVDNLYTLLDEQREVIEIQDQAIGELEQRLGRLQARLRRIRNPALSSVIEIETARQRQEIRALDKQRGRLLKERCAKLGIAELLETNIREFSDRLANIHRSTLLKLVWDNPHFCLKQTS